jgi:ferric iron reductase protein FhuF
VHNTELLYRSLSHYFHVDVGPVPAAAISSAALDDPAALRHLIAAQPPDMADPAQPNVSGVMTAKLYGTLAVATIFAAALFDRALPTDRSAVYLLPGGDHGFRFLMPNEAMDAAARFPEETGARRRALQRHLAGLFEGHLAPVWDRLAMDTGADHRSMWSLLSTNIATLFLWGRREPYVSRLGITAELRARMDQDEALVFAHGEDGPFPGWSRNPLVQPTRLFTPPAELGPPIFLRTKCCLRYRLRADGEHVPYCSTCPKISDEQRVRLMERTLSMRDAQ